MAREDFLKNLSRTLRQGFRIEAGNGRAAQLADKFLAMEPGLRVEKWLTPDAVAGYDPNDFGDLSEAKQKELTAAVEEFQRAVTGIPPNRDTARRSLAVIVTVAQPLVRDEWSAAVEELIQRAEDWSRARGWAIRRYPKEMEETLLGRFEVAQLLVHLREGRIMFDPVSRFVAGGKGLVDLYAMPSLSGRSIVRRENGWELLPSKGNGQRKAWTEEVFDATVRALAREAA